MMTNEIKAGDTVRLKSGGPLMTVGTITDLADCMWFVQDPHSQIWHGPSRDSFPVGMLDRIDQSKGLL